MVRSTEVSVYMPPSEAADVHEAAEQSEYNSMSEYVRSFLPECSDE